MANFKRGRFAGLHQNETDEEKTAHQRALIMQGDLKALTKYLEPLIKDMLDFYHLSGVKREKFHQLLIAEVPHAASLYKRKAAPHAEYQFATYYTWFAKEKIERNGGAANK